MNTYLVTFEINSKRKSTLEVAISTLAYDFCELHENAWLFSTDKDEKQISDTLFSAISNEDRIFFCIASKPYNCFIDSKAVDYIKSKKLL